MNFPTLGNVIAQKVKSVDQYESRRDASHKLNDIKSVVYDATRKMSRNLLEGTVSDRDLKNYTKCVRDADFLFDDETCQYLAAIRSRIFGWCLANSSIKDMASSAERSEWERIRVGYENWIAQMDEEFDMKLASNG